MDINPFLWVSFFTIFLLAQANRRTPYFMPLAYGAALSALAAVWVDSFIIQMACFLGTASLIFASTQYRIKKAKTKTKD